ncbi:hypothetical protein G6L37_05290 [Agrobacterium rubi]|nr:hypothetical protein [Agrobacterium rubi]NTF24771.1 hypothetical protein [Agrobacterium rubi]
MPFPASVYSHRISFEIPAEDFLNLLNYETANYREFDLPVLSSMLDRIDGVDDTNYSGHFGSQVFSEFDVGEDGQTPQITEYQALLDEFFTDARRIATIMPELMIFPRHDLHDVMLKREPDARSRRALRSFLYGDDDFLIATGENDETVTIFHREGGELGMVDAIMPISVARLIASDRRTRSFHRSERKPITMSRDINSVRQWVQKQVGLDIRLPTVDVSDHHLAAHIPDGGRAVLSHRKFILADGGRDVGLSVTFISEGAPGTMWFVDESRRSILWNIERSGGALGSLNGWILRQLPRDVEQPGLSGR